MNEPYTFHGLLGWTAPDKSFTVTAKAIHEISAALISHPLPAGWPDIILEGHIFAMLTMFEGYDDATAHRLCGNDEYAALVHTIADAYKEWKAENAV